MYTYCAVIRGNKDKKKKRKKICIQNIVYQTVIKPKEKNK